SHGRWLLGDCEIGCSMSRPPSPQRVSDLTAGLAHHNRGGLKAQHRLIGATSRGTSKKRGNPRPAPGQCRHVVDGYDRITANRRPVTTHERDRLCRLRTSIGSSFCRSPTSAKSSVSAAAVETSV